MGWATKYTSMLKWGDSTQLQLGAGCISPHPKKLPSSVVLILAKISALAPACSCNSEGTCGVYLPIFLPVHPYRLYIVLLLDSPVPQHDITMTYNDYRNWEKWFTESLWIHLCRYMNTVSISLESENPKVEQHSSSWLCLKIGSVKFHDFSLG